MALPKITILGDSSVLPRPDEGIPIDKLYSTMIANLGKFIVFNRSGVSADTDFFLESRQLFYDIRYSNSEFFIIHLGICDCSPRLFTKKEKKYLEILSDVPFLSSKVANYIRKKSQERLYHTQKRQIQNVPLDKFKENYTRIIKEIILSNPIKKIFLVNILSPGEYLTSRSFGIQKLVQDYNKAILDIHKFHSGKTQLIDMHKFTKLNPQVILKDGHHFNIKGHKFIFDKVISSIF